jgi:hypothetical protein
MLQAFPNGTIAWSIDHDRRVVLTRWEGDIRGDELLAESPALWRDHPEIVRYGTVHDLIDFTGIIEHRYGRALMQLRAEHFGPSLPETRTALVSLDPMKIFELKVTEAETPNRQFRLFNTNSAALEWVTAEGEKDPSAVYGAGAGALPWWFDRATATR